MRLVLPAQDTRYIITFKHVLSQDALVRRIASETTDCWIQPSLIHPGKSVFYKPPFYIVHSNTRNKSSVLFKFDWDWCYVDCQTDETAVANNLHINCEKAIRSWKHNSGCSNHPIPLLYLLLIYRNVDNENCNIEVAWVPNDSNNLADVITGIRHPNLLKTFYGS